MNVRAEFGKVWVFRDGKLVEKGSLDDVRTYPPRSDLPCPMLISDHLPDLRHPITGKVEDSKSAFRRMTREAGCVEVGDQAPVMPSAPARPEVTKTEIAAAVDKVRQGYKPTLPSD